MLLMFLRWLYDVLLRWLTWFQQKFHRAAVHSTVEHAPLEEEEVTVMESTEALAETRARRRRARSLSALRIATYL